MLIDNQQYFINGKTLIFGEEKKNFFFLKILSKERECDRMRVRGGGDGEGSTDIE